MSERVRRGISRKNAGLLLALAFSLIAAGVVLFFVVRHKPDSDGSMAAAPAGLGTAATPPVPEVPPVSGGTGTAGGLGAIAATGRARLQFVDQKDPSRIASEMEWLSLEPLEQRGRSMITEPRFWLYPSGGMTVHIQAQQARVFQPNQQSEPESGRLERGVIIRGFEAGPDGERRAIDLEKDVPLFMIATDSLNFDTPIGEISTLDPWEIMTAEIEAAGVGLRLQVNQLGERLELLEVDQGGSIRYSRTAAKPKSGDEPAAATGGEAAGGEAGAVAAAGPKEDLYLATFTDEVRVTQGSKVLTGDTLNVWARLLDGALPENAVPSGRTARDGGVGAGAGFASGSPAAVLSAAAVGVMQPGAGAPSPAPAAGEDDLVLTWTGTLVVRPLAPTPAELQKDNHLALRLTADKTGLVTFADTESGISGRCVWIGYQATSQDLTMAGPGPATVTVSTQDGKGVQVGRMELNLGTGVGFVPGAGVLSDADRRITWTDQSDLQFAAEGGSLTGALREAAFTGNVLATNPDGSSVKGDFLRAVFTSTQKQATALARLIVEGKAVGDVGDGGGTLSADKLDLLFQPSAEGGDPEPRVLTAVGDVRAQRGETTLTADFVETTLRPEAGGKVAAEDVHALGQVRIRGERGLAADTEELIANVPRQHARLTGRGSFVGQGPDQIFGSAIELDGLARAMTVIGEGKFVHAGDGEGATGSRPMTATWTRSMTYDDRGGIVECHGGVVAGTDPSAPTVDLARGEHLRLELTPAPVDSAADTVVGGAATEPVADEIRKLLRAEISGDGESDALVETRTYVADAAAAEGRRLTQFMRLTGVRIVADDVAGTLSVPGAGRAAIYDGRSTSDDGQSIAQEPGDLAQGRPFRGSALFIWTGAMSTDRATGLLQLRRAVQMVHRPLGDEPPATMECERLDATFSTASGSGEADASLPGSRGTELVRALARDAVYVESGGRKLLADAVAYDAAASTAEATADEGNRVTLYDQTRATPVTARRLFWDLAQDRIHVREPTPIVTPMMERR